MSAMPETNKQRLIRRAAELMGPEELARRLRIPPSQVEAWIRGDATMPDGQFRALSEALDAWARDKRGAAG